MELSGLIVFAAALTVAAASPGPAITALVARVLVRGTAAATAFMLGLSVGDVVWLTATILGLAFIAKTFALAFLWSAPAEAHTVAAPKAEHPFKLFFAGLSLTLGNPKTMVFYLALLPNLINLRAVSVLGYSEPVGLTFVILVCVDGGYVLLASRARRLFQSPRAMRWVNRGSGALMAGAAAMIATR